MYFFLNADAKLTFWCVNSDTSFHEWDVGHAPNGPVENQ